MSASSYATRRASCKATITQHYQQSADISTYNLRVRTIELRLRSGSADSSTYCAYRIILKRLHVQYQLIATYHSRLVASNCVYSALLCAHARASIAIRIDFNSVRISITFLTAKLKSLTKTFKLSIESHIFRLPKTSLIKSLTQSAVKTS